MRSALTLLLVAACSLEAQIASDPKDIVLKSMLDELERSRKLKIEGLEPPYFVQYTLDDAHSFSTSAALGATLGTSENRFRVPRVRVRVGDPSFDNTNYIFSDFGGNSRFDADQAPIDNDYRILRRNWWLATDRAYKGAVESIARKRAALKSVI
ncbi:MAG: peptidase U62, partial [Bryobacteraceae bacterium]|nr:peptidase U62 [Bryobacteraceae bacterium]